MIYKEIFFPVEMTNLTPTPIAIQEVHTSDTECIQMHFQVLDLASIATMTPQIVLFMQDGSIYQITNNIVVDGLHLRYDLSVFQSNHAGLAYAQLLLKEGATQVSSPIMTFNVISGLIDTVPIEVEVSNWTALTDEILTFVARMEENEDARAVAESIRVVNELLRKEAESRRQEAESNRLISEWSRIYAEEDRVQAELEREFAERIRNAGLFEALIGDRNYLRNSRTGDIRSVDEYNLPISLEIITEGPKKFTRVRRASPEINPGKMTLYNNIPYPDLTTEIRGRNMWFSFLVRASQPVNMTMRKGYLETYTLDEVVLPDRPIIALTDQWKLVSTQIEIPETDNVTFVRFCPEDLITTGVNTETFYLDICEWKVSYSNTAWSPAPEDLVEATEDEAVAMISSSIQNLSLLILQQAFEAFTMTMTDHLETLPVYTWVKFATDETGTSLSDNPLNMSYIGIAKDRTTATESINPNDYVWSEIISPLTAQGITNVVGVPGAEEPAIYTWVKYADSPTTGMSDLPTSKPYIGLAYNKTTDIESLDYADYSWHLISEAIESSAGVYTWLKYADTPTTGMSDSPTDKQYMGLAYNKNTSVKSENYSDYSWSLIDRPDNIVGEPTSITSTGAQGRGISTIVIAYQASLSNSVTPVGTWLSSIPALLENEFLWTRTIVTFTDTTTLTAYAVSPVSPVGSIVSTSVTYQSCLSNTAHPTKTWTAYAPLVADIHYLWTRIAVTYSDGSTTMLYHVRAMGEESPRSTQLEEGVNSLTVATDTQGPKGATTTSVVSTVPYYLVSTATTGVTTDTSGWALTPSPVDATNRYLWCYEVITFSDSSVSPTIPRIIGVFYYDPETKAERVLETVTEYYLATDVSSNVTGLLSGWTTTPQTTSASLPYLWNYKKLTWSSAPVATYVDPILIAVNGDEYVPSTPPLESLGVAGPENAPLYTWIKYAYDTVGLGLSDDPTDRMYIGLAYNKSTFIESDVASDYTWHLIDEPTGIEGPTEGGVTVYTWIKYADTPTTGMSNLPANKNYIGIAYNKTSPTESTNYADYSWSLIRGQGLRYVTEQYYRSTSDTIPVGADWLDIPPPFLINTYMWTRFKYVWESPADITYSTPVRNSYRDAIADMESRIASAEIKLSEDAIVSTVRNSSLYIGDLSEKVTTEEAVGYAEDAMLEAIQTAFEDATLKADTALYDAKNYTDLGVEVVINRLAEAEQKITPEAITNTVTSSETYLSNLSALEPTVFKQLTAPPHLLNRLWLDTSSMPNVLYRSDGVQWIKAVPTTAEEVGAYSITDAEALENNLNTSVNGLVTTIADLESSVEVTATSIRQEVAQTYTTIANFATFQTEMSTAFTQTNNSFLLEFNTLTGVIESVDGKLTANQTELLKYIRFVDGTIVLGQTDSVLSLEIQNDRISFKQSGEEVAYITNNILYITDGRFLTSLRVGNFAFTPRTNGNLSFSKVVS